MSSEQHEAFALANASGYILRFQRSAPKAFAVPVAGGRCFDLDITIHAALAGETQRFFVADPPEEQQRAAEDANAFPQAKLANVVLTFGDHDLATATEAPSGTMSERVLVNAVVDLHSIVQCRCTQRGTGLDFDGLFLFDEGDFGHNRVLKKVAGRGLKRGGMIGLVDRFF